MIETEKTEIELAIEYFYDPEFREFHQMEAGLNNILHGTPIPANWSKYFWGHAYSDARYDRSEAAAQEQGEFADHLFYGEA